MLQLITRCPQCETAFAFEAAQLRLAEGWVRCGKCSMLFEADKHLFERETEQPYQSKSERSDPRKSSTNNMGELHSDLKALHDALSSGENSNEYNEYDDYSSSDHLPLGYSLDLSSGLEKMRSLSMEMQGFSGVNALQNLNNKSSLLTSSFENTTSDEPLAREQESITQERGSQGQGAGEETLKPINKNGSALAQILTFSILILLAICQILWSQKEVIGALSAQSHLLLQSVCSVLGTQLDWPMEPESLRIESSSFKLVSDDIFRIKLRLKNHQDYAVKTPQIELVLLAADESVLVRKIFSVRDLELQEAIAADKDLLISFNISVDEKITPNVVGYRLDFFYP